MATPVTRLTNTGNFITTTSFDEVSFNPTLPGNQSKNLIMVKSQVVSDAIVAQGILPLYFNADETVSLDQEKLVLANNDQIIAVSSQATTLTFIVSTLPV